MKLVIKTHLTSLMTSQRAQNLPVINKTFTRKKYKQTNNKRTGYEFIYFLIKKNL